MLKLLPRTPRAPVLGDRWLVAITAAVTLPIIWLGYGTDLDIGFVLDSGARIPEAGRHGMCTADAGFMRSGRHGASRLLTAGAAAGRPGKLLWGQPSSAAPSTVSHLLGLAAF